MKRTWLQHQINPTLFCLWCFVCVLSSFIILIIFLLILDNLACHINCNFHQILATNQCDFSPNCNFYWWDLELTLLSAPCRLKLYFHQLYQTQIVLGSFNQRRIFCGNWALYTEVGDYQQSHASLDRSWLFYTALLSLLADLIEFFSKR